MAIQLRRYQFAPGTLAEFLPYFPTRAVPLRASYGFSVVFAYADHVNEQFVWAVEYPGTADELRAREAEYLADPEWSAQIEPVIGGIVSDLSEVIDQVWPPQAA
ncbi:NIPSNAP family protein [Microbacterium sp. X-17]|uniref:NIPSNAP family protein n=1 Tax=Microbacterium sp. X-17 TaxID=3144404 RepID=UPI0031F4B9A2